MAAGWIIDLAAVLGLAALCGVWVAVQAFVGRRDPCQPGVEGRCGCKGWKAPNAAAENTCERADGPTSPGQLVHFPTRR